MSVIYKFSILIFQRQDVVTLLPITADQERFYSNFVIIALVLKLFDIIHLFVCQVGYHSLSMSSYQITFFSVYAPLISSGRCIWSVSEVDLGCIMHIHYCSMSYLPRSVPWSYPMANVPSRESWSTFVMGNMVVRRWLSDISSSHPISHVPP